jgi:hypothetical protein
MKTFELHFRYRDGRNELFDKTETCTASSNKEARQIGNRLAQERANEHDGKYWFIGLLQPST